MNIADAIEAVTIDLVKTQNEYQAEVERAAEEGFRPSRCFHGTYQWTEYDPMCWGCEDPETPNENSDLSQYGAYILGHAENRVKRVKDKEFAKSAHIIAKAILDSDDPVRIRTMVNILNDIK